MESWSTSSRRRKPPESIYTPLDMSSLLGSIGRQIRADWQSKYGHPVDALETFVDRSRFRGTCYRAANWVPLGATQGRSRNDRDHGIRVSIKEVYLSCQRSSENVVS